MKLNGEAYGHDIETVIQDAHRQAKQFFGTKQFTIKFENATSETEYNQNIAGDIIPAGTSYTARFQAEHTPQEEQ